MPKLIVTSRYLKSGSRKNLANYVKYIATREGSVPSEIKNPNAPVSSSQQELISSMLNDFSDSKDLHEYEDYKKNTTVKRASEFISAVIDRNMDQMTDRKNYVGYLANRPGAVKFGSHGLFSQDNKPINLEKTAQEISEHKGNVWTHVVSLRRDNAQQMGYDNLTAWRDLVKRQIPKIAENQKISLENLRWYAAFHDREFNPHAHILVYSKDEKEGFLTKHGIEKIRSSFANDIYYDELHHLYAQQMDLRNLLKLESKKFMEQLADNISNGNFSDIQLNEMICKLHSQLNNTRGRKVYGYLSPNVKMTVDDIFSKLAENESIQKMYATWCEMEQQKHDVYSSAKVKFSKLVDNKEFKSVKNMIINQVVNLYDPVSELEFSNDDVESKIEIDDIPVEINIPDEIGDYDFYDVDMEDFPATAIPTEVQSKYYIKWTKAYKSACKFMYKKNATINEIREAEAILKTEADSGNVLAIHDLAKLYSTEKLGSKDEEKPFAYYKEALQGFMEIEHHAHALIPFETKSPNPEPVDMRSYFRYRIGKMHCYGLGTEQNYEKAFDWFYKASQPLSDEDMGNKYAQYSLANLYYYGNGVEKDLSKALHWYKTSAQQGQPYASYAAAGFYIQGGIVDKNKTLAHEYFKQALDGFLKLEEKNQADDNLYYKIGLMYKNGFGSEIDMKKSVEYFKQSAELNNKNGLYEYGKALLLGEHIEQDIPKALECLEKSNKLDNSNAKRFLALEYISGERLQQNTEKGITMLTELIDSGDTFSAYKLGKIYFNGEVAPKNLGMAEKYLLIAASDENQFAQYTLGKLYLTEEKYNLNKAVEWLEMAVKQDNEFSKYQLAKILIKEEQYRNIPRAAELLESIAKENSFASYQLGKLYLFGAEDFSKDKDLAIEWLTISSEQGNIYAQNLLNHMDDFENAMISNAIFGLFMNLSRCIADDYNDKFKANRVSMDRKLRSMIQIKRHALGMKDEPSNQLEKSY